MSSFTRADYHRLFQFGEQLSNDPTNKKLVRETGVAIMLMCETVIGQVSLRSPIDMDSEERDYRFHAKRDDDLFAEWREWDERIKGAKQWGASLSVADEFRRAAASELRRRGLAVPSE